MRPYQDYIGRPGRGQCQDRRLRPLTRMSAYDGGLNGWTQHFILERQDGVYADGARVLSGVYGC